MKYFIGKGNYDGMYTVIDFVYSKLKNEDIISVDTETTGLDHTKDHMIMLQIGTASDQFAIDVRNVNIKPLAKIFESHDIVKILHNAKFDYIFLREYGIIMENVYDTMLAERVLYCGNKQRKYSLNAVVNSYLNIDLDKSVRHGFTTVGDKPFTKEQITYGLHDVEYLFKIKEAQDLDAVEKKVEKVIELENQAVLAFGDIEYNGLDINKTKWEKLYTQNKEQAEQLFEELDNMVMEDGRMSKYIPTYIQGDLFLTSDEVRKLAINWDSPKQVLDIFKCILPRLENVNSKQLSKYKYKVPLIGKYIKYKETMKLCTSYGERFYKYLKHDGRIHTNFHQILETGRVSSNGPNMQQIPADNAFRNCFTAPDGWKFVSADYSSQELNVIAFGSQDPVWMKALQEGKDLHSVCADLVYGKLWYDSAEDNCKYLVNKSKCDCPKHKSMRTNIKTVNFGLAYGMGPHKLSDTLNIDLGAAKQLIYKYFVAFPKIKGFLDKLGKFGMNHFYIKTFPPYNRRRWFERTGDPKELSIIQRASKNTPIQGASADMTKAALVLIRNYIRESGQQIKLVMTVHDQIDTICEATNAHRWSEHMKGLMELAAVEIVTNGLLKAEVSISDYWQK